MTYHQAVVALLAAILSVHAYLPHGKENLLTDALLREVVDRMGRDLADAYIDFPDSNRLPLEALMPGRTVKDLEQFPVDYDHVGEMGNPNPSIRDQEYLQHSTLWGHQYMAGEGGQQQQTKGDAALPAYCNPPNPCPHGSTAADGCLDAFDNTAAFSRDYQAAQDCMCDAEHMFDCPAGPPRDPAIDSLMDRFQVEDQHKSLVAKKFHISKDDTNPFLIGERLPIAAKKGKNVVY